MLCSAHPHQAAVRLLASCRGCVMMIIKQGLRLAVDLVCQRIHLKDQRCAVLQLKHDVVGWLLLLSLIGHNCFAASCDASWYALLARPARLAPWLSTAL